MFYPDCTCLDIYGSKHALGNQHLTQPNTEIQQQRKTNNNNKDRGIPCSSVAKTERLLLNHAKTPGFSAPGGEEFNPGPEMRLDRSELLCNKVLLKYKGGRESFLHRHQKGAERVPPC